MNVVVSAGSVPQPDARRVQKNDIGVAVVVLVALVVKCPRRPLSFFGAGLQLLQVIDVRLPNPSDPVESWK